MHSNYYYGKSIIMLCIKVQLVQLINRNLVHNAIILADIAGHMDLFYSTKVPHHSSCATISYLLSNSLII